MNNPLGYVPSAQVIPITARFVTGEAEALTLPKPTYGCAFYFDQNLPQVYAKYADGRDMETYELVKKEPPAPPKYLTEEDVSNMLDKKFEELKELLKPTTSSGPITTPATVPYKKYNKHGREHNG